MDFSIAELAVKFGCDFIGNPKTRISYASTLISAQQGAISFYTNSFYLEQLKSTKASVVVIKSSDISNCSVDALLSDDPYLIFSKITSFNIYRQMTTNDNLSCILVNRINYLKP